MWDQGFGGDGPRGRQRAVVLLYRAEVMGGIVGDRSKLCQGCQLAGQFACGEKSRAEIKRRKSR